MRNAFLISATLSLCSVAAADPGVSDTEILLGEASAFSGPSAGLGVEQWRGESAAIAELNDAGGVHGRKLQLVLADDGYDAEKAAPAVLKLITNKKVFALVGGVGTPTIVKALPVILKFNKSENLFRFANFTGAQPQREPPYDKAVFNIRASYREETKAMVDAYVAMGKKKIGIFVQDDAYGASGRDGVKRALADHNLSIASDTTYPRGQTFDVSAAPQVKILKDGGVDAIVAVGSYAACAALVRDVRATGWEVPIHNVSFVGADQMLKLLRDEEVKTKKKLTTNLIVTQVVPSYNDTAVPLVAQYRAAMDKYAPQAPNDPVYDRSYKPTAKYSFGSLEGYMNIKALAMVLDKTGKDLSRKAFIAAAEGMGKFDLGVGSPAELTGSRHQALNKVWFTYAGPDGWVSTDNVASVIR